jgi:thioredoxin reductase/Pyruvate/2-oxoacid:ferredoxin oxidoreductase delta subunit
MDILTMELLIEKILIYATIGLLIVAVILIYIRKMVRDSGTVDEKIRIAKEEGLYEPVSLHPVVDPDSCIKSGACILACPEDDVLGIRNGKATAINASRCVGHGACFHACPTQAISLCIGTEKRGVDIPHVNKYFESNVSGIYIAGEIGGMGLIKNAVEQGKQAVENIVRSLDRSIRERFDLIIVGAGPAGISASLVAKKHNLKFLTLEQDSLGGTVFTFPRSKIVMTSPMDLPLYGKVKMKETSKEQLLELWNKVLNINSIQIKEYKKVEKIVPESGGFIIYTKDEEDYHTQKVLLAIGRRGSPRKLNIPGENLPKVAYRLLEPELIKEKNIVVVGGGDSAVESALLLSENNNVILSYRKDTFLRLKQKNKVRFDDAVKSKKIDVLLNSNLMEINEGNVIIRIEDKNVILKNDLVYIFAGGELPAGFLKNAGIEITRKFGEAVLKHDK